MMTFADAGIEISSTASGPEVQTTCPRCSRERKKKTAKCLSVNTEKKTWICHHCGWTGGLGKGDQRPHETHWNKPAHRRPDPRPNIALPQNALDWFRERGITDGVLLRNGIDYGRVYMPQIEEHAEAVIFPYFRNGELINRKYRTIARKEFRLEAGCELILYGFDDIDTEKPLIWVEGECDKLAIEVAGFCNCVSVPNGAPSPESKNNFVMFRFLEADEERIRSVKMHIIAVDSDGPGQVLEAELSRRLGVEKCRRVRWPDGVKDANEMLIKHGAVDLAWYIENAEPFPIDGIHKSSDFLTELFKLYDDGRPRLYCTGFKSLDPYLQVRLCELTAVTGIPGSGKSNWLDHLYVNLARLHDWRFAIFSPENLPIEFHIAAYAEKFIRKPFFDGPQPRMSRSDLEKAVEWVDEHFRWILPKNEDDWTIESILGRADQLCLRDGIHGMVIDPWNEIESTRPRDITETEFISHSLKRIRVFARQRQIHVWVVVHPAKLPRGENGKYPVPTLYDCAGSAHWRNKADNGIVIWRDLSTKDEAEVEVHVQKIRFRYVGRRGMVTFRYDPVCATYSELYA
jgi:twinkle protein